MNEYLPPCITTECPFYGKPDAETTNLCLKAVNLLVGFGHLGGMEVSPCPIEALAATTESLKKDRPQN